MPGPDLDLVDAAAGLEGLTDEQRDELSDRIHEEKKQGDRRDLSMQAIRKIAKEIKLEYEGRSDEIEPEAEELQRTQRRGEKHEREEEVAREKEKEEREEVEERRDADHDSSS